MLRASDGILELLPIATFICDAKGTILQYNHHVVAVWGGAPSPGQTHEQFRESARFFELDGTPVERSLVAEVLETGNSVRDVERIVEYADGSTLIVSVNIDPLRNTKGELVGRSTVFSTLPRASERMNARACTRSNRISGGRCARASVTGQCE
jgi:PAS domain-containing protein